MVIGKNEIIEEYISYLSNKGRITKIKDKNMEQIITFSNGLIYYFLMIISILCTILIIHLITKTDTFLSSYDLESKFIITSGFALFSFILICIANHERKKLKLKVNYLNDYEMKLNNDIYHIENNSCYIDIERSSRICGRGRSFVIKYYLVITKNKKRKTFILTPGCVDELNQFMYNFEFEISDFKKQKYEALDNFQLQHYKIYKKYK